MACTSAERVPAWHDAGVANGGSASEDPPDVREEASGQFHLAYLRKPGGNKIYGLFRMPKA